MMRITQWIDTVLAHTLIVLMVVIVLDVSWQVITRFILQRPSSFTEELATFLLIWIGLLGASYALRTKSHLGIDVLTYKLKGVKRCVVDIIVYMFVFVFALFVMLIGGLQLVQLTFTLNQMSAAMNISMGYVYLVIPLSGMLMMFYSLLFIKEAVIIWMGLSPKQTHKDTHRIVSSID